MAVRYWQLLRLRVLSEVCHSTSSFSTSSRSSQSVADSFFASVYPTITSGKSTKVIIVSTPHGMNHFYRMWHDAERQLNEYVPTDVHWSEVPGRDEKWKATTIKNTSEGLSLKLSLRRFLGSVDTLIAPSKLKSLVYEIQRKETLG